MPPNLLVLHNYVGTQPQSIQVHGLREDSALTWLKDLGPWPRQETLPVAHFLEFDMQPCGETHSLALQENSACCPFC